MSRCFRIPLFAAVVVTSAPAAAQVTALRINDLDLRDPHVFVNPFGSLCVDMTDTPFAGFSVNGQLQTAIVGDAEARPNPRAINANAPVYTRRMPNAPSAEAAKKLPITSPTPVALTRRPSPMLPPPRSSFASTTSATFTHAVATAAVHHTTSTVSR